MEFFDLYNHLGEPLHKTVKRGEKLNPGEFHLVVHIWIRNSEGKYLVQQRNKLTDETPFMWAATGGAVTKGETSLYAAIRETKEEIGLALNENDLKHLNRYFIPNEFASYITDLYLVEQDVLLNELELDTLEVRQCKYFTMDEIKVMVENKQFWDYENLWVRKGYLESIEKS
ncbi:MAG: NUDIX domain-containing protein [Bacilli bacterium]|nr:NUDIX domain-containing protein [Bacilli bacterium]